MNPRISLPFSRQSSKQQTNILFMWRNMPIFLNFICYSTQCITNFFNFEIALMLSQYTLFRGTTSLLQTNVVLISDTIFKGRIK